MQGVDSGKGVSNVLGSMRVKTEVSVPKSRTLIERKERAVPSGATNAKPVFVEEARGALAADVDGNTFVDLLLASAL